MPLTIWTSRNLQSTKPNLSSSKRETIEFGTMVQRMVEIKALLFTRMCRRASNHTQYELRVLEFQELLSETVINTICSITEQKITLRRTGIPGVCKVEHSTENIVMIGGINQIPNLPCLRTHWHGSQNNSSSIRTGRTTLLYWKLEIQLPNVL